MSQLTDFCSGEGRDCEGRLMDVLLFMTDKEMEASHDFIQWI
jgi:hypothetical protein